MGGNFSQELIDRVREAVDIVEIISEYVPLKRAGRSFRALCPFHEEKTPSFHVNPEKQIFHCFGCHQGGNVFTFLMAHERITFPEAVKTLAERAGVEIEESVLDARSAEDKGELRRLNLAACRNYQKWLSSAGAEAARDFLKQRTRVNIGERYMRRWFHYEISTWDLSSLLHAYGTFAKDNRYRLHLMLFAVAMEACARTYAIIHVALNRGDKPMWSQVSSTKDLNQ
jgi:hypothetical protein